MYLSKRQLAKRLCISPGTVSAMVRRGDIPHPIMWGPLSPRWPLSEIEEFEKQALANRPVIPRQPRNNVGRPPKNKNIDHDNIQDLH